MVRLEILFVPLVLAYCPLSLLSTPCVCPFYIRDVVTMLRTDRPSTAPAHKSQAPPRVRSAQATRPLGRFSQLREAADAHGSNIASVMASIKGDIVALQHRRDELLQHDLSGPSVAMQSMEQHLAAYPFVEANPLQTAENRCQLLEMLVQLIKVTSAEIAGQLHLQDEEGKAVSGPYAASATSRISGFLDLMQCCDVIAKRKKLWESKAENEGVSVGTQPDAPTRPRGSAMEELDNALNEPAVSQLRQLIQHQKQLQKRLSEIVPAQTAKPKTPPTKPLTGDDFAPLKAEIASLTSENANLKRRVTELDFELKRVQEEFRHSFEVANEDDFGRVAASVAFAGLDKAFLGSAGVDTASLLKVLPPGDAEGLLASKIGAAILEGLQPSPGSPGKGSSFDDSRRKKDSIAPQAHVEGGLWVLLKRQNLVLQQLSAFAQGLSKKFETTKADDSLQVKALQRSIESLQQQLTTHKNNTARAQLQSGAELQAAKKIISNLETRLAELTKPAERTRLVSTKGQHASPAEREKALEDQLAHNSQCIRDLSEKLQQQMTALAQEEAARAAVTRERQQLLQLLDNERQRVKRMVEESDARAAELHESKDIIHSLRKELREKAAVEADLQQQHWKLEVELHIAQNVMNDLRLREEDLSKKAADAKKCQLNLREAIEKERKESALKFAKLEEALRVAKSNEAAAKENLKSERARMLGNEKEVERLRALDTQMEQLEQNFTNYAASKLAQRDAQEDEEKQLQLCVEALMRDPFALPLDGTAEDEVVLYLESLRSTSAQLEQEDRVRRRSKIMVVGTHGSKEDLSGKKQLLHILQERYNQIQIFAAEQRIRQMAVEKETQRVNACYLDLKQEHDRCLQELSMSKVQCESLVQRNTELELERTQLLRNRASAELEIKNLKGNVQRLKIHGEEQEKILIEVGTQLQTAKIANQSLGPDGNFKPIGLAILEE
jgi:hypothetical protein